MPTMLGSTRSWNSGSLVPVAPPSSPQGTLYDVPTRPWRPTSNASALGPLSSGAERIRSSIGRSGRPRRVASRAPSSPRSRIAAISRWSRSRRRPRRSCPTFSNPEKPVSGFPPGAELLRPCPGLEIVADPDALRLRVLVHRLKAELPTHAAHLGSAERRGRVDEFVGIHPDHARLELRRDPVGSPQVARPEARPESVRDAVGHLDRGLFVLEGRDRDERTEDFLLADSHLRVVGTDQRGLHVVPAGRLGRPRSASAEQDLPPFAFRDVHVSEHPLLMILRRERSQLRRLLERIPDSDGPSAGRKPFQEIIPDRLMDKQTRSRDARLSLVVVCGEEGTLDRGREVRVREDDVRSFPAEFQEWFLQRVGSGPDDFLSYLDVSSAVDIRDIRMAGEPRSGHRAF